MESTSKVEVHAQLQDISEKNVKKLNKAKNDLPETFRFSKKTSQQDTGECYVSFIKKRTRNSLFRGFKLFHEKGKRDFYRKSKSTVMKKCLRQKHIVK